MLYILNIKNIYTFFFNKLLIKTCSKSLYKLLFQNYINKLKYLHN